MRSPALPATARLRVCCTSVSNSAAALFSACRLLKVPRPGTAALVTNLAVHFKLGRENALAWVTSLDKGKVVEGWIALPVRH